MTPFTCVGSNVQVYHRLDPTHVNGKCVLGPPFSIEWMPNKQKSGMYNIYIYIFLYIYTVSKIWVWEFLSMRGRHHHPPPPTIIILGWRFLQLPASNVRGEPVFSVMTAGWFCEKSGWIGKVEDVKPVLFEKKRKRISTGNHFEEEGFYPDELWNRRISSGLIHLESDLIRF